MLGHVWLDEAKAKRVNGPQSAANPSQLQTASPLLNRGPGSTLGWLKLRVAKIGRGANGRVVLESSTTLFFLGPVPPGHRDTNKPLTGGRCNEVHILVCLPNGGH
jgi:hypothetical protein